MAFANKQKSRRKPTFKNFGNFLALHMLKRFVRRNKTSQTLHDGQDVNETDREALEAGFDSHQYQNGSANGGKTNGITRSNSLSATNNLSISQNKNKIANGSAQGGVTAISQCNAMPGVFGLANHGNTCFMNSVTQCLSNTDLLAEYFVMGQYKQEMKICRKDRSKKYGTKGEVTEQLALIVKSLWMGLYSPDMTKSLKELIGKYAIQYKGSSQHDSQEFLLWLFDKMHEDLNMMPVKKKMFNRKQSFRKNRKSPTENAKASGERTICTTDLSPHSFIQKTFQGHYHSSLTCPTCKKKSETVDPYLCVSLPLKQRTTRPIYINVVYLPNKRRSANKKNLGGRTIRIGVSVEINGKINNLRQAVAGECGIHSRLIAFADLHHDGFHDSFGDDKSICDIPLTNTTNCASNMTLYAFEMPPIAKMTAGTLPRNFTSKHKKRSFGSIKQSKEGSESSTLSKTDSIVIILINKQGLKEQGKRFGKPLVFRTSRDVLMSELQSMILSQMSDHLKNGVRHDQVASLFRLQIYVTEDASSKEVVDGLPNKCYLPQSIEQPLRLPTIDKALDSSPAGSPLHIKLVAEWDVDTKAGVFEKFPEEKVELQDSVRLQRLLHQQPVACTLQECFDLHTEEEELGPDDGWMCSHCNTVQHGTRKKLSLYTLPDIFVLHLKRFRVENGRRTKLATRVEFPVTGLDMAKHIYSGDMQSPLSSSSHMNNSSSYCNGKRATSTPDDTIYDLYAVCNHYGNLNSGHYTACCCNPLDGRWYLFDDEQTECISEEKLSSPSVYILFYQRRSSSAALSCGGASINSVMSDHWAYNLPQIRQRIEFNSQSHLNRNAVSVNRAKSFATGRKKPEKKSTLPDVSTPPPGPDPVAVMQRNVNSNSNKIAAALKQKDVGKVGEEDSDDGGFASTSRPFAKGLRRQGSAVAPRTSKHEVEGEGQLGGRQYRSYRHTRTSRTHRTSHV